jgi:hypothetical protein
VDAKRLPATQPRNVEHAFDAKRQSSDVLVLDLLCRVVHFVVHPKLLLISAKPSGEIKEFSILKEFILKRPRAK